MSTIISVRFSLHLAWHRLFTLFSLLLLVAEPSYGDLQFPGLTGRVVDSAGFLSAAANQRIAQRLQVYEKETGNQLVVASVPDLQGVTIEEFGYRLGRHWGIGQKGGNNGVLLLFAREERKVRIEVGYGLEGQLTDALSANIIQTVILPHFKKGQFDEGIEAGALAVIDVLGGQYQPKAMKQKNDRNYFLLLLLFFIFFWPLVSALIPGSNYRGWGRGRHFGGYYGSGRGGLGGGSGWSGGGFSGGGGSFGGGGASGSW